ncbi:DUF3918 family protein [Bacillus shivajii]|uniref:DUF3918 family protein n=1 Tax=Bacillus shivajii TaxID=1983719 RepID=UPI001CF9AC74|nr:DUF3918 family protein [Bacillus shivajii]UCZ54384.1 DUF3918 family protein [Bacillus shivajii]
MRVLASLVALGVGAYAYATNMDNKSRKRWKKRLGTMDFSTLEEMIPNKRSMKRMQKRMTKALT